MIKKRNVKGQQPRQRTAEPEENVADTSDEVSPEADLQELLALRKLQRSQARQGIDVVKLNRGELKKVKAKAEDAPAGISETQKFGLQPDQAEPEDEDADDDANQLSKKIVRSNNFTQQTNALDVDKHLMSYIEEGLKKRRGENGAKDESKEEAPYDPHEELFRIDERYKIEKKVIEDEEGNVTNSVAMLTAIPEVDLGMDVRLRNIEATEKAKHQVAEERRNRYQQHQASANEPDLGATRFYRPQHHQQSDEQALRIARSEAQGIPVPEPKRHRGDRRDTATDEQVMERFKKRMRK